MSASRNLDSDSRLRRLITARLSIEPLAYEHEAIFCKLQCDRKTMRQISEPLTLPAAQETFSKMLRLQNHEMQKWVYYAVRLIGTTNFIGIISVVRNDEANDEGNLGIILDRTSHGRGVPLEALTAVINEAFRNLSMSTLVTQIKPSNIPAIRLMRQLKFSENGKVDENSSDLRWALKLSDWFAE